MDTIAAEELCEEGPAVQIRSFSRLDEVQAEMRSPASVPELAELLKAAKQAGRKVTFRGGGYSFHDQSLGKDLVICLQKLDTIDVDAANSTVTVGPGATWFKVVEDCKAHNRAPYVVPSGEGITCGGSLAAAGIGRHSPSFGGEHRFIASFDFLKVGASAPITVPRPAPSDNGELATLFRAVIGSFGYLGVVTSITYDVLDTTDVGAPETSDAPLEISTEVSAWTSWEEVVAEQLRLLEDDPNVDLDPLPRPDKPDPQKHPAVYAVGVPYCRGRGAVFKSSYTRGVQGESYITYRRGRGPMWRFFVVLLSLPGFQWLINWIVWSQLRSHAKKSQSRPYVNSLTDYLFFLQGQVDARQWYERWFPCKLPVIEQTFVCPVEHTDAFLQDMRAVLRWRIQPTLLEFLFLPKDRLLMSANHDLPGFAITLAFQDIQLSWRQARAIRVLEKLSERLLQYGGRIRLTKNVYADSNVLREMYQPRADAFLELKAQYDPDFVLRNAFFDRLFLQTQGS